jgi:hypothetical protein
MQKENTAKKITQVILEIIDRLARGQAPEQVSQALVNTYGSKTATHFLIIANNVLPEALTEFNKQK